MTEQTPEESPQTGTEVLAPEDVLPVLPLRAGPRPRRRAFVPLWVWGLGGAVIALLALGIGVSFALNRSVTTAVPDVIGLDSDVARSRVRSSGFEFLAGDRRFSTQPEGTVLEQSPEAGVLTRRGSAIRVVVSAGTEEFRLPDIVGSGILLGRGVLEARGLEVKVNVEASDQPKDTVLSTNPSADSVVHTGDIVIVTVASSDSVDNEIIPYQFTGAGFVIDASKPSSGSDVCLEIARRLRSLLEASGAPVNVTRELGDKEVSVESRAKRVVDTTATAVIGIDVTLTGAGGFGLSMPSGLAEPRLRETTTLLDALVSSFTLQDAAPSTTTVAPDALSQATSAPLVRVSVGSVSNNDDVASFTDPAWADQVARAIYHALGETYGHL